MIPWPPRAYRGIADTSSCDARRGWKISGGTLDVTRSTRRRIAENVSSRWMSFERGARKPALTAGSGDRMFFEVAPAVEGAPMGTKADGAELVKDQAFERLLSKMDTDAEAAEKVWKKQLASPDWAAFPSGFVAQYKDDGASMIKSQKSFSLEWNKIVAGRGDLKRCMAAYDAYSGNLVALVENSERFAALLALNAVTLALTWIGVFKLMFNQGVAKLDRLDEELKKLEEALEEAKSEVSHVEWKRRLNALLSAVTLVAVPEAHLVKVLVAAGAITLHVVIDHALGEGTAKGTIVFVVGDGVEFVKRLGEAAKKFAGAAAAVVTFKFDSDELTEVEEARDKVQERVSAVQKALDDTVAFLGPMSMKLRNVDIGIAALCAAAQKAMSRSYDAAVNYEAIRKAMKQAL